MMVELPGIEFVLAVFSNSAASLVSRARPMKLWRHGGQVAEAALVSVVVEHGRR